MPQGNQWLTIGAFLLKIEVNAGFLQSRHIAASLGTLQTAVNAAQLLSA